MENVNFTYPARQTNDEPFPEQRILSNLNLNVYVGETVAIAGISGSGKSTIAALLLRLFDPLNGSIKWNGTNISQIDINLWRHYLISAVLQESSLFSGTIAENILYSSRDSLNAPPHGSESENKRLQQVVDAAQISSFIEDLTGGQGLETMVGDQGLTLSGGQKQRILIARALYKQTPLIVMDEATSALDAQTEMELFKTMKSYLKQLPYKTTIITIAHRLATLKSADRIVLLGVKSENSLGANVVAEGTFDSLANNNDTHDLFQKLLQSQEV